MNCGSTFEVGGTLYHRKSKLNPKKCSIAVFSDFGMSGRKSQTPFERRFIPPLFDLYNIYFVLEDDFGARNPIRKMLGVEDVLSAGFVDYTEDYLTGYNFYIQTTEKLYVLSSSSARQAIRWVESLRRVIEVGRLVQQRFAKHAFADPARVVPSLESFDPKSFLTSNLSLYGLKVYKLNERFDRETFAASLAQLKQTLRVLKFNEGLAGQVQPFLMEFHALLCKSLANTTFEFSISDMSAIYKSVSQYNYLLEKYQLTDVCLLKFLVKFNNALFEQLTTRILADLKSDLAEFLSTSGKTENSRSLYQVVFDVMIRCLEGDQKLKIGYDLCYNIIARVNQLVKRQVVLNQDIGLAHLVSLLRSCLSFSDTFFRFASTYEGKRLDDKFINSIDSGALLSNVEQVIEVVLNEMENHLERPVQRFFTSLSSESELRLSGLLDRDFKATMETLKDNVGRLYTEPLFNRVLNFLLTFYFSRTFLAIADAEFDHGLAQRLQADQATLYSVFAPYVETENLKVLLETFDHLLTLLSETRYEELLRALIKFDLFFSNRLSTEVLVVVLAHNIELPIDVEEALINHFNYCIFITQQKNQVRVDDDEGLRSKILFNSSRARSHICNYLPSLSLQTTGRLRKWVARHRQEKMRQRREDSIDLSLDIDLVNASASEKYLENIVKLLVFEGDRFEPRLYVDMMRVS